MCLCEKGGERKGFGPKGKVERREEKDDKL